MADFIADSSRCVSMRELRGPGDGAHHLVAGSLGLYPSNGGEGKFCELRLEAGSRKTLQ